MSIKSNIDKNTFKEAHIGGCYALFQFVPGTS